MKAGSAMIRFRIEHYRAKVAESERNARMAKDPQVRESYLQAAASWRMLAERAEQMEEEAKPAGC